MLPRRGGRCGGAVILTLAQWQLRAGHLACARHAPGSGARARSSRGANRGGPRALQLDRRGILRARRKDAAIPRHGNCASSGHSRGSCAQRAMYGAINCFSWRAAASIASSCPRLSSNPRSAALTVLVRLSALERRRARAQAAGPLRGYTCHRPEFCTPTFSADAGSSRLHSARD